MIDFFLKFTYWSTSSYIV